MYWNTTVVFVSSYNNHGNGYKYKPAKAPIKANDVISLVQLCPCAVIPKGVSILERESTSTFSAVSHEIELPVLLG